MDKRSKARGFAVDGRLLYWWLLLIGGFAYVAVVLCGRPSPFQSRNNAWGDWLAVFLSGPTLYYFAARHTLWELRDQPVRALLWNGLAFGLPFFATLHWEWVGRLTHTDFSITARQLAHLHGPNLIAFAVEIILTLSIGALCIRESRRQGFMLPYILSFVGLIALLIIISWLLGPRYYIHLHHYFLGLCLIPFVRFRTPVCFVTQAFLAGIYIEGACRFGLDPVWIARY